MNIACRELAPQAPTPMTLPPPLPSHTLDRTPPKQAVILAAGVGSRLGTSALEKPKCLLPLSHKTLLEIQIETYLSIGVEEVCVVVGYRKELIEPVVKRYPNTITIENPIYANSNSLYSLWLTREWIRGAFACSNADVVAHPDIFRRILETPMTALGMDTGTGFHDEHMKIEVFNNRVRSISKSLPKRRTNGENVGILSIAQNDVVKFMNTIDEIVVHGGENLWVPAVLHQMVSKELLKVHAEDITGLPWIEIDFGTDLLEARRQIWPLIAPKTQPAQAFKTPTATPQFVSQRAS